MINLGFEVNVFLKIFTRLFLRPKCLLVVLSFRCGKTRECLAVSSQAVESLLVPQDRFTGKEGPVGGEYSFLRPFPA